LIMEQNNLGAILLVKRGVVSSQAFIRPYHLIYRIVVAPQRDSYRSLTTPQPSDAMLPLMHAWEGGCLRRGGPMRLLGMFDAPKRVTMVGVRR
jgi:hypothetical protein